MNVVERRLAGRRPRGREPPALRDGVFRAVETRRYLVRAAITGVSGVVDPYGRVLDAMRARAHRSRSRPRLRAGALTPYVRFGDAFAFACVGILGGRLAGRIRRPALRRRRLVSAPAAPAAS